MPLTCTFTDSQRRPTTPRSLSQGGSAGSNPVGGTQQVGDADCARRRAERGPEGADAQRLAVPDACEDQVVRLLAVDVPGKLGGEEPRDRHLAALVGLGVAPQPLALHRRDGLDDDGAAAAQVEPAHPQGSHLAEPDPGVGEEEHDQSVRPVDPGVEAAVPARIGRVSPLFPIFDYHPIITDRSGPMLDLEADHRRHAEVELTIRDLKHDMGMSHFPTKSFGGNAAWLVLNTIAHNLTRWTARLGLEVGHVMTKKIRRRIYSVAGRLIRTGRRVILRLPRRWPWADQITAALERLRAVPAASGWPHRTRPHDPRTRRSRQTGRTAAPSSPPTTSIRRSSTRILNPRSHRWIQAQSSQAAQAGPARTRGMRAGSSASRLSSRCSFESRFDYSNDCSGTSIATPSAAAQ